MKRFTTKYSRGFLVALLALASLSGFAVASGNANPDTSSRSLSSKAGSTSAANVSQAIKDDQGRIRYIVDLVEDKAGRPASFADANSKITYQRAKSAQTIDDVTRQSGVMILGTTSFVGISFVAYLTE